MASYTNLTKALVFGVVIGFGIAKVTAVDPNATPTYGNTGAPKNCRAIIQSNLDGVKRKQYSVEDALESIERNCGAAGYSWGSEPNLNAIKHFLNS